MKAVNAHSDTHLKTFNRLYAQSPLCDCDRERVHKIHFFIAGIIFIFMLCLFYDFNLKSNKENFIKHFFRAFFSTKWNKFYKYKFL